MSSDAERQNLRNQLQRVLDENKQLKGELQAARLARPVRHGFHLCIGI
jgi:hypothetical protein